MNAPWLRRCEAALGPGPTRAGVAAAAIGLAALAVGVAAGLGSVALGTLAVGWLFLAGLAAGSVAFAAAVRCSRGNWVEAVSPMAEAGAAFFPVALAILAVLVAGSRLWMPDAAGAGWRAWASLAVRDLVASALLFWCGRRHLRLARATGDGSTSTPSAIVYLLLYAAVLSLWAIDLVMSLHEWAPSTVVPVYYFMGAFLGAIALTALLEARGCEAPAAASRRHDLGKLLFAMVIMWGYLLWAAYLPVWYGGLPDETGQLLARWAGGWKLVTAWMLGTVLAFPFFFLMPERTKRGRTTLTLAAASILVGLFAEHFLLVLPSLPVRANPASIAVGAGVALGAVAAFVLTVGTAYRARRGTGPAPR